MINTHIGIETYPETDIIKNGQSVTFGTLGIGKILHRFHIVYKCIWGHSGPVVRASPASLRFVLEQEH